MLKDLLKGVVKKVFLRQTVITEVVAATPHFRQLTLQSDAFKGAKFNPGDKLQVGVLGLVMRTYTPLLWDPVTGTTQFLLYIHEPQGPGAAWASSVREGDTCDVFGPRDSLNLTALSGPVVFFGDETAFACARLLDELRRTAHDVRFVFETSARAEAAPVLRHLGLHDAILVEKLPDGSHLEEAHIAVTQGLRTLGGTRVLCVGNGQTGQALRRRLRKQTPGLDVKVKAYWVPGKAGLD